MSKSQKDPVYKILIGYLQKGFNALDTETRKEIISFIKNNLHSTGAFIDRAGNPDLYYSLFGLWLCLASGQNELLEDLAGFVKKEQHFSSPIEELAVQLIATELDSAHKKSVYRLVRTTFIKGKSIDLSYQFFLIALVIDATAKHKKAYFFLARLWLQFYHPKGNLPCSLQAALVYARKTVGIKTKELEQNILPYSVETGGFRAFDSIETTDILSTGVSLFVLKEIGFDLRMIAPVNLDFIQQNYDSGAFLSGDGDLTKDLEYTFYGLLALGSLV